MVSSFWILACTLIAVFFTTNGVSGTQRCYVCIPNTGKVISEIVELFPSGPELPLCNKFKKGKREFMRDCPDDDEYKGCIHEINGTHIAKTCARADIQDCKTANGIEYCYCIGDLCNIDDVPAEEPRPAKEIPRESTEQRQTSTATDDEDSIEGSGSEEKTESQRPKTTTEEDISVEVPAKSQVPPPANNKSSSPKTFALFQVFTLAVTSIVVLASF